MDLPFNSASSVTRLSSGLMSVNPRGDFLSQGYYMEVEDIYYLSLSLVAKSPQAVPALITPYPPKLVYQ